MSERLKKIFQSNNPKTKLVAYFVGCYPDYKKSLELIKKAIDNGVSVIECGYPTSEASAEGPVIKIAHDKVLENGDTLKDIIKLVSEIRNYNQEVGIVLMGYIANLYKYPISKFVTDISDAGADACLVVDAPHELKEENILNHHLVWVINFLTAKQTIANQLQIMLLFAMIIAQLVILQIIVLI